MCLCVVCARVRARVYVSVIVSSSLRVHAYVLYRGLSGTGVLADVWGRAPGWSAAAWPGGRGGAGKEDEARRVLEEGELGEIRQEMEQRWLGGGE